jgi:uncharacterized protein YjdB
MFFFVLFLPITGRLNIVQAKEVTTKEDTTVKEVLPEIKLNVNSRELVKGKSFFLKVYNTTEKQTISYKTSDENYVTVTDTGLVKGIEIGSATITVTVKEGNKTITSLQCDVTVGVPALSVRITKSDLLLVVGQSTTLKVLVAPYNTVEEIRFSSSDYDILDITPGGRIKANNEGVAYVYAIVDNDFSKCKVVVISEERYQELMNGNTDSTSDTVLPSTGSSITSNDKGTTDGK